MDWVGKPLRTVCSFLLGVGATLSFLAFYHSADFDGTEGVVQKLSYGNWTAANVSHVTPQQVDKPYKDLAEVLKKAANKENTVILTEINHAFAAPGSLLDLFLESFHAGENIEHMLNHLVVISVDENAYSRCKSLHPYCYFLRTEGVNYAEEQQYMRKDYLQMMWARNKFQLAILELGFNFLFTDVDIVWFRDTFRYISMAADIAVGCDKFFGDPYKVTNEVNGGFLYAKSCNKTIEFYKFWQEGRNRFGGHHEQDVFNYIKAEVVTRMRLQLQFLDTSYIGTFCQLRTGLNKICTIHANCCVGVDNKYHDLKVAFEDWKNFTAKSAAERWSGKFRLTDPGKCIHWKS